MKTKDKLLLVLWIVIFTASCLNLVNSAPYVAGNNADIRYSVRVDGGITTTALCNITIADPKGTVIIPSAVMSFDPISKQHNYTLLSSNTSAIGAYCFDITCQDSSYNATKHDCITITPAGQEVSSGQAIMYIFMLILCVLIFALIVYGAFKIDGKNVKNEFMEITGINYKKYLKYFLIFLSYFFLMFIVYLGFNVAFAFLYIPFIEKIFMVLWNFMVLAVYLIVPFYFLYNVVIYIQDRKIISLIERNLPTS